jgi:hypothetical protein
MEVAHMSNTQFPKVSAQTLKTISHSIEGERRKIVLGEWLETVKKENPELYTLLGSMALVMSSVSDRNAGGDFLFGAALVYHALSSQFGVDAIKQ